MIDYVDFYKLGIYPKARNVEGDKIKQTNQEKPVHTFGHTGTNIVLGILAVMVIADGVLTNTLIQKGIAQALGPLKVFAHDRQDFPKRH